MARPKNSNLPKRHVANFGMTFAQREALNRSAAMNRMTNGELVVARFQGRNLPMSPVDPLTATEEVQGGLAMPLHDHNEIQEAADSLRMNQSAFVRSLMFGDEAGQGTGPQANHG